MEFTDEKLYACGVEGGGVAGRAARRVKPLSTRFVTLTTSAPHTAGQNPAT